MSLPALEFLRSEYTEVWVPSVNLPLFWFADRVRAIAGTGIDLIGVTDAPLPPELYQFDRIVSWYGSNRAAFRAAVRGLPVEFHDALPGTGMHASDFYSSQVGAPLGAVPQVPFSSHKRDFIAIHPFSGSARKNWPLENFQQLAGLLPLPVEWAVTASGEHRFEGLREVAEWLSSARLYVGNDSGITHLSAAVGTPTIALFHTPQEVAQEGQPDLSPEPFSNSYLHAAYPTDNMAVAQQPAAESDASQKRKGPPTSGYLYEQMELNFMKKSRPGTVQAVPLGVAAVWAPRGAHVYVAPMPQSPAALARLCVRILNK